MPLTKNMLMNVGCVTLLATASAQAAPIALYDFELGGSGQDFNQAGNDSVDTDPFSTASRLSTGGPQGLDGGGANNIFNTSHPGSDSGPPVSNWGNSGNTEANANFALFTITPDAGKTVVYDSLSLFHGSFNATGQFKITYQVGAGVEVLALAPTSHTAAQNDPLTKATSDFADFTTNEVVTWRIYNFGANDNNTGFRFDDITINGTTIPSPSALGAGLIGLCGLAARRRRG